MEAGVKKEDWKGSGASFRETGGDGYFREGRGMTRDSQGLGSTILSLSAELEGGWKEEPWAELPKPHR